VKNNVQISQSSVSIKELLNKATKALDTVSETPRLDAELLLSFCLKKDKLWLYTHINEPISNELFINFSAVLKRRLNKEPISYIIGYKEFWKDKFLVTPQTLIPRPETELIVEHTIIWCKENNIKNPKILDLGTGSGNICLSILREIKGAQGFCLDISFDAIKIAQKNANRLKVIDRSLFFVSNWFSCIKRQPFFDVIVTNPPYISTIDTSNLDVSVKKFEPQQALFSGKDGLLDIKNILNTLPFYIKTPMLFMSEIGFDQGEKILKFLKRHRHQYKIDFSYEILRDLTGLDRVIKLEFN